MPKITLDSVVSGYDLSKINSNFQRIQSELNEKVLYRNPPSGEPNTLEKDIDANGKAIFNLGGISIEGFGDIVSLSQEITDIRDEVSLSQQDINEKLLEFYSVFLGSFSSDPILDNEGQALQEGALYYNTTLSPKRMRVYDGIAWNDIAAYTVTTTDIINVALYASQAEAVAGTNPTKVITPLTAKQALDSRIGTTANKLVSLDGTGKLPAVDGSQLTNLPGTGGGAINGIFYENEQTVTANYTLTSGKNAGTFGPVSIDDGIIITVPDGSTWSIV